MALDFLSRLLHQSATPKPKPIVPATAGVNIPQNLNIDPSWSLYGDSKGNKWYENPNSNNKIPIAPTPQTYDSQLSPQRQLPYGSVTVPIQYQRKDQFPRIRVI